MAPDPRNHIISTGADGNLDGMSTAQVLAIVDKAFNSGQIVMHFHGGLVNKTKGIQIAESLLPVYTKAGAYPLFFVWRSGALENITGNIWQRFKDGVGLLDYARVRIGQLFEESIFNRLLRKVMSWSVGILRDLGLGRGGTDRPDGDEMAEEMGRLELGGEPFAELSFNDSGADLDALENDFISDVDTDDDLRADLSAVLAYQKLGQTTAGGRGLPAVQPEPTLMDRDVLVEISDGSDGQPGGARGVASAIALARKAWTVVTSVVTRFRQQTDHGPYPTVLEELARAFYLGAVGGTVWKLMKDDTRQTFDKPDRGGRLVVNRLAELMAQQPSKQLKITLVGHSTGAVFINNLLAAIGPNSPVGDRWNEQVQFQIVLLAPACTTADFANMLTTSTPRIGRLRIFTMTDAAEQQDHVVGQLYPRSLLYLVSGLLEREGTASTVRLVLGLSRYLDDESKMGQLLSSPFSAANSLPQVRKFLPYQDHQIVLSPNISTTPGRQSGAARHQDFDDDPLVRESLKFLVHSW